MLKIFIATYRDFVDIFPLVARPGGVLERRGHTEANVDFCAVCFL